jgi:hypothetical protein
MRKLLFLALLSAAVLWIAFAALLLGYQSSWLPNQFLKLTLPTSLSDFGQSFSVLEGLVSSIALMLGLSAFLIQVKQNSDSNIIGAFSARQAFLLAEYERLNAQIAEYIEKNKGKIEYNKNLIDNMINRRKERLDESKQIDEKLKQLLSKI